SVGNEIAQQDFTIRSERHEPRPGKARGVLFDRETLRQTNLRPLRLVHDVRAIRRHRRKRGRRKLRGALLPGQSAAHNQGKEDKIFRHGSGQAYSIRHRKFNARAYNGRPRSPPETKSTSASIAPGYRKLYTYQNYETSTNHCGRTGPVSYGLPGSNRVDQ